MTEMITPQPTRVKVDDLIALAKLGYTIRSGSRLGKRGGEPIPEWQLFDPFDRFIRTVSRKPVEELFNAGYHSAVHSFAGGILKGLHR